MTDANETPLPLDGEGTNSPSPSDAPPPAARKTPRRKMAARSKLSAVVTAETADSSTPAKPRRRRAGKAAAGLPAQSELLPPPALSESPDPETHIETRVIPPALARAIEEKTTAVFGGTDGENPVSHAPAAAPSEVRLPQPEPATVRDEPAAAEPPTPQREHAPSPAAERTFAEPLPAEPVAAERVAPEPIAARRAPPQPQGPAQQPQPVHRQGDSSFQRGQGQRFERHSGDHRQDQPQSRQGGGDFHRDRGERRQHQPHQPQQHQGGNPQAQPQPGAQGVDGIVSRPTEIQFGEGIIEVSGKGFGFLREAKRSFVQTPADIFVTPEVCRKYNLRDGQWIKGEIRRSSRGPQLFRLTALNGEDPERFRNLPNFDELTTINPKSRIRLETDPGRYTTRVMDLMTPIGKGQRGLIVAPPRTGKTTLLQHIAEAVVKNHPEMKLIILLVDERPEEVTEIRRTVPQAEMMASSNDSDLKSHTRIAQLAIERAKRLVEASFDVFILLDSLTRVGRAFNNAMGGGGRTMSGGIDARAMEIPRKIFAAARNTEEAGSLTIMATALIETGSRMDEVIFQEFKGTGNMELVLDRKISDQRIYPAVDIFLSGTRREELLLQAWELDKINVIRRGLAGHKPIEAIERLLSFMRKFPTNAQMLASLPG